MELIGRQLEVGLAVEATRGIATGSAESWVKNITANITEKAEIKVDEKLKNTAKNSRYVSTVTSIDNQHSLGKLILNVRKPNQIDDWPMGSHIEVIGSIYQNKNKHW